MVAGAVEHARKVAALDLVVANDLGPFERLRIAAVQHDATARQPFIAFVADPRYAHRTRVGSILPYSAVGRSFAMPSSYEGLKAFVGFQRFRLLGFGCARNVIFPLGLVGG